MTSLALKNPVKTRTDKGKPIQRHYYWNIQVALEGGDRLEDAIEALEEDKVKRTNFGRDVELDLSTTRKECEQLYFPCNQIVNSDAWEEALQEHAPEKFGLYMQFRRQVLYAFRNYQLPVIQLGKATSKEAVCLVFEKVNTGGVPLNVFELVTATYAADGFNLRDDWHGNAVRKVTGRYARLCKEPVLSQVESTDYLQAVSMLYTLDLRRADVAAGKTGKAVQPVSAKRASILAMPLAAYQAWADEVEAGFLLGAKFLRKECVKNPRELPYRSQLAPLASVLAHLRERWLEPRIYQKLSQWYWCGVLGELYGGATESRFARDIAEVVAQVKGDPTAPITVQDAGFRANRLLTLRTRNSAAYKGIYALLMRDGGLDFRTGEPIEHQDFFDDKVDIHHIFPEKWCKEHGLSSAVYNSVVNKTALAARTNRSIGGRAPSRYLPALERSAGIPALRMDEILRSHRISPELVRADRFSDFLQDRADRLLECIEVAMGKPVARVPGLFEQEQPSLTPNEALGDWGDEDPDSSSDGQI